MRHWLGAICLLATACQKPAPSAPITFDGAQTTDKSAIIAHGERLTHVLGCRSCHGADLAGHDFFPDDPAMGKVYSANLTREVPKFDDIELERLLREGRRLDGRDLWIMPSDTFQHLSAPDMVALIAALRTLRPSGASFPPPRFGPKARQQMASGDLEPERIWVAEARENRPLDLGPDFALGRYLANSTCAECHGFALEGWPGFTPDLVVAGTYSREEFERLLTTGTPTGGRTLGRMAEMARVRFVHLTRHERDALYAYLKARAESAG